MRHQLKMYTLPQLTANRLSWPNEMALHFNAIIHHSCHHLSFVTAATVSAN